MHDRLAGVPPSEAVLDLMEQYIDESKAAGPHTMLDAANIAINNPAFYSVTLKNIVAPWTNREQDVFVPLNDYIATYIGLVRDEADFRRILYDDVLYVGTNAPAYSNNSNAHYEALEAANLDLGNVAVLQERVQSDPSIIGLPSNATAGVMTSRAGARAFFFVRDKKTGVEFEMSSKSMVSTQEKKSTSPILAYQTAAEPLGVGSPISLASEITNTKDQAGRVLAFELEPGMYEISKWKVITSGGIDFAHFDSEHRPPIAFEVKSGEVSYLCNCHIDVDMGENIFGLAVEDGAEAAIYDKMQRDMQYIDEKYPNLRELKVNNIAANLRVIEHPLAP
jgi:hypothetical protein